MSKLLHPRVQALKVRSNPINYSTVGVGKDGKLLNIRASADETDPNIIKGYLFVWGVRDSWGTMFMKGCCTKSIQERGPGSTSNYKIDMLWQHRMDEPIGQFTVLKEDDYGLYFECRLDDFDAVPRAKQAASQVKSGTLNQFSGGFDFVWDKMEYIEDMDAVLCKEIELWEGSVVTIGGIIETHAIRSGASIEQSLLDLADETDDFINSLPRAKRLEARTLITRHKTLAKIEPPKQDESTQSNGKPSIDIEFINKNIKLF